MEPPSRCRHYFLPQELEKLTQHLGQNLRHKSLEGKMGNGEESFDEEGHCGPEACYLCICLPEITAREHLSLENGRCSSPGLPLNRASLSGAPWDRQKLVMPLHGPAYDLHCPEELWRVRMYLNGKAPAPMYMVLNSILSTKKTKQNRRVLKFSSP